MTPPIVDFQVPFDPTGYTLISGAELLQLVSGLAPQAYIGWNVVTDDDNAGNPAVPNANTYTKFKYYTWIRRAKNGGVIVYVWNPAGSTDATYLNWQVANIASIISGSITGAQIAGATITGANIAAATIPWGCMIAGAAVGGCLTGTMPNPALAARTVTSAAIGLGTIVGGDPSTVSNLADRAVEGRNVTNVDAKGILDTGIMSIAQAGGGLIPDGATGKLRIPVGAVEGHVLRVKAGALMWESKLNSFVKDLSGDVLTGNKLKIPQVNVGETAITMVNAPVLQVVTVQDHTTQASTGNAPVALGADFTGDKGFDAPAGWRLTFTPKLSTSYIEVTATFNVGCNNQSGAAEVLTAALFLDNHTLGGHNPFVQASILATNNTTTHQVTLRGLIQIGDTVAHTIFIKLATTNANAGASVYFNKTGSNVALSQYNNAFVQIREINP